MLHIKWAGCCQVPLGKRRTEIGAPSGQQIVVEKQPEVRDPSPEPDPLLTNLFLRDERTQFVKDAETVKIVFQKP